MDNWNQNLGLGNSKQGIGRRRTRPESVRAVRINLGKTVTEFWFDTDTGRGSSLYLCWTGNNSASAQLTLYRLTYWLEAAQHLFSHNTPPFLDTAYPQVVNSGYIFDSNLVSSQVAIVSGRWDHWTSFWWTTEEPLTMDRSLMIFWGSNAWEGSVHTEDKSK